jgi:hypothetical protein
MWMRKLKIDPSLEVQQEVQVVVPPVSPAARRKRPAIARLAVLLLWVAMIPAPAMALNFSLEIELDDGIVGDFGNVEVLESEGELDFAITLTDALGPEADLHEFYFNLASVFTGVGIKDTDARSDGSAYVFSMDPSLRGGAGASFDYGVNLGNGGGRKGNGRLKTASFTVFADQMLSLDDLLKSSFTSGKSGIEIIMAAHVQGTRLVKKANSETIGAGPPVPEPSTSLLLMTGLGLLAAHRSRRSSATQLE